MPCPQAIPRRAFALTASSPVYLLRKSTWHEVPAKAGGA